MLSLPASVVWYSLCPYMESSDILNLRLTNSRLLQLLHDESESKEMWKLLLIRDFGFRRPDRSPSAKSNDWWKLTLKVKSPVATTCKSVFGIDPGAEDPLVEVNSPFDAWKGWMRASRRFFEGTPPDNNHNHPTTTTRLIYGPYFLRAARIWRQIHQWCSRNSITGDRILKSMSHGLRFQDWEATYRWEGGLMAAQAIYAFCGGQQIETDELVSFDGLFGGYQAYNFYCNSHLVPVGKAFARIRDKNILVSQCNFSSMSRMPKLFTVNIETGSLSLITPSHPSTRAIKDTCVEPKEEFMIWMEYFSDRLATGKIGAGSMGSTPQDLDSITLYPRYTIPQSQSHPPQPNKVPYCSYAVTRGVEVIASAVYAPQAADQFGYIYSIRIRLVTSPSAASHLSSGDQADNSKYMSVSERGFETCQLLSRQWEITNFETNETDRVQGEGVIGMYPILREGGYTEASQSFPNVFQYQSCSGPIRQGSFGGTMTFVPGTIKSPTGPPFEVEMKPFLLDDSPDILY